MAEKCTNTSSPVERWMNPYPFAPLNHFTVPFSLTEKTPFTDREELFSSFSLIVAPVGRSPLKVAGRTFSSAKRRAAYDVQPTKCGCNYSKNGKDSSVLHRGLPPLCELRSPTFGAFPPHPTDSFACFTGPPPEHLRR